MTANYFTAVNMKSTLLWDVTPCDLVVNYRGFEETAASIFKVQNKSLFYPSIYILTTDCMPNNLACSKYVICTRVD
jgi:hypothetical protein